MDIKQRVLEAVCDAYDVSPSSIRGHGRSERLSGARAMLAYCLAEMTGEGAQVLGPFMNRDRTTIIYHQGAVEDRLGHDQRTRDEYMAVLSRIASQGVRRAA